MNEMHLTNVFNLVLCFAWGWSAMCRLAVMHRGVMWRVKLLYLLMFVASFFDGLQFYIFGTFATWPDVVASALLCALLCVTVDEWRNGAPACVRRA